MSRCRRRRLLASSGLGSRCEDVDKISSGNLKKRPCLERSKRLSILGLKGLFELIGITDYWVDGKLGSSEREEGICAKITEQVSRIIRMHALGFQPSIGFDTVPRPQRSQNPLLCLVCWRKHCPFIRYPKCYLSQVQRPFGVHL